MPIPLCLRTGIQAVPALTARVIDQTSTLSAAESSALESRLSAFEQETGAQVVVLMVMTTAPEDIASYANRVANTWKIGRKDVGDGLLLLVAKQDRKIRIEVAKSLEGAVPDLAAKRVIDEAITPHFKQGRFAAGIDAAISQISALIRSESLPAPTADSVASAAPSQGFSWTDIGIFLFFAVPVSAAVARSVFGPVFGVLLVGLGTGFWPICSPEATCWPLSQDCWGGSGVRSVPPVRGREAVVTAPLGPADHPPVAGAAVAAAATSAQGWR